MHAEFDSNCISSYKKYFCLFSFNSITYCIIQMIMRLNQHHSKTVYKQLNTVTLVKGGFIIGQLARFI